MLEQGEAPSRRAWRSLRRRRPHTQAPSAFRGGVSTSGSAQLRVQPLPDQLMGLLSLGPSPWGLSDPGSCAEAWPRQELCEWQDQFLDPNQGPGYFAVGPSPWADSLGPHFPP